MTGPQNAGPIFPPGRPVCHVWALLFQVLASWQWSNCLHAQAPPSQEVLRINMDETSIRLYQDAGKGLLVARACRQRHTPRGLVQKVTRSKLRAALTHAALLCDDPEAQRALPQLLIAGEASMTAAQEDTVRSVLPRHVVLLRMKKGWMNADVMCWLAEHIHASLRAWRDTHVINLHG